MRSSERQELAALSALGILAPAEAAPLEALLAHDPAMRAEAAEMNDVAAVLALNVPPTAGPSPQVRAELLRRIQATPQAHRPAAERPAPAGFHFVKSQEGEWQTTPFPGIRMKMLSLSREIGYWTVLADLAPGARFPTHDHTGSEQLYILSGHLHTEGRVLGPGDFLHAEPGTHHGELHSPDGCTALLVERVPAEVLSQMGVAS